MDGRWQRLLAGGLLCTVMGCGFLRDKRPGPPGSTGEPPIGMSAKPGKDNEPLKVETLLAVANVRMQAASDESRTSAEREELRNQARLAFQQVLQREPKNLDAMLGMARLYAVLKEKDKCLESYQRASKAYPKNAEIMFETGKVLGSHFKDKDSAISFMHAATKLDSENRKYRSELGFTLALAERYNEAYEWLSRVMTPAEAHYNLAGIMDHNGRADQAKMHFALALQADPGHEKAKMAMAYYANPQGASPLAETVRPVSHEQWTPVPALKSEPVVEPKQEPQVLRRIQIGERAAATQSASIELPEPPPLKMTRPDVTSPALMPSSGWDK